MKILKFLVISFVLISCSHANEKYAFDSIEYSLYMGYTRNIKINKNGQTYISLNYSDPDRNYNYSLVIDKVKIESISNLISSLPPKLDSIYDVGIANHPISFSFIIKSKGNTVITSYSGDCVEKELKSLFALSNYFSSNIIKITKNLDSVFVFKSKSRLILPPPPVFEE
jgi:hypothetical protein